MRSKETVTLALGQRIKEVRKSKGISQLQLAHLVHKDQQSIQRLESGKVNPSIYYLLEISDGLEVSIIDLFIDFVSP